MSSYSLGGSKRTLRVYDDDNDDVVILESGPKFFFLWKAYHDYARKEGIFRGEEGGPLGASDRLHDTDIYILKRLWPVYTQLFKSMGESAVNVAILTVSLYKDAIKNPENDEAKVFQALANIRNAKDSKELADAQAILDALLQDITNELQKDRNNKSLRIKGMTPRRT
jgi:hypothetical protein